MNSPAIRAYRFGNFRVDLRRRELRDGAGTLLPLSARAYDALVFLLENRRRVVSKDELMNAVWPQTVVEENNLNQAITILRRALGDRRVAPQYVRTVAGRGYRFVGEVTEEVDDLESPQATRVETGESAGELAVPLPRSVPPASLSPAAVATPDRRRLLLLGLGLAGIAGGAASWLYSRRSTNATARVGSLAVLPFRPLVAESSDPALEFGMTDALITRLSSLPGIVVRPLSSVRKYVAVDQNSLEAGRELGAETVLEGHLLIRENRVRLTARLLEVASGAALWTGSFEEPLDQFLDAQDALAAQVVGALQIELTDSERETLLRRPTDDVRAWQLYSNARYLWERKTPEAFRRAIEYYEAAERLDPGFALAAVGQADAWAVLGVFSAMPPADAFGRARAAAERALRTAPELPEGLAAMGHILVQGQRDWRGGERLYRRALDAKPRFAQCRMWLANDCAFQGRLREGLTEARRAHELEPLSPTFAANVGNLLYYLRDYAAALAQLEPLVEADPGFQLARQHLARVLVASGAPEKAIPLLMEGRSAPGAIGLSNLGRAYAAAGRRELAEGELRRLEEQGARGIGVGYDLALIHAALGDEASALSAIERAVRDGSQGIGFLNSEPGFDPIREKPRFRAVSHQLGLG